MASPRRCVAARPDEAADQGPGLLRCLLDGANVRSALLRRAWVSLDVELDRFSLGQSLERGADEPGRVEEDLLACLSSDEAKAPVSNESDDLACHVR
jgi:hypothetical protein